MNSIGASQVSQVMGLSPDSGKLHFDDARCAVPHTILVFENNLDLHRRSTEPRFQRILKARHLLIL
jgi:hypothetical protein